MSNNHETRETSHGTLETCIQHRESDIERRETSDKRLFFMQNEPNFKNSQNYTSACIRSDYVNFLTFYRPKNKAKRTQNEPNLKNDEMNITTYNKKGYVNFPTFHRPKNEPKRTQNEPNFSPKLALFFPKLALLFTYALPCSCLHSLVSMLFGFCRFGIVLSHIFTQFRPARFAS